MIHTVLNKKQQRLWQQWLAERPPLIRALAQKYPGNRLFRLKTTGHNVIPCAYNESGTLTVMVLQRFNPKKKLVCERQVFGIKPEDLEEIPDWEKPDADRN